MKNCVPLNVAMRVVEWSKLPGSAQRWLAWCWRWWHLRLLQCHVSHDQWFWTEPLSEMRIKKYSLFTFKLCLSFCTYINLGNWNKHCFFNPNELQKKETILNFLLVCSDERLDQGCEDEGRHFVPDVLLSAEQPWQRSCCEVHWSQLHHPYKNLHINTTYCWNNLQMSR